MLIKEATGGGGGGGGTQIRAWIRNYISGFLWDVMSHPWSNLNSGSTELPLIKGMGE